MVQPQFYKAMRILFVRKENKNNDFIQQLVSSASPYSSDPQIWLARSTFLQSLAPTVIKLTYLWFSSDSEDTD